GTVDQLVGVQVPRLQARGEQAAKPSPVALVDPVPEGPQDLLCALAHGRSLPAASDILRPGFVSRRCHHERMTDTSAGAPADPGRGADAGADESRTLTRTEASDAVSDLGWRYILGWLRSSVPAASLAEAAELATRATAAAGPDADATLWMDVRHD